MLFILNGLADWLVLAGGLIIGLVLGEILYRGAKWLRARRPRAPLCNCGHPLLYADDAGILSGHMRGSIDPEEGGRCLNDKCTGGPGGGPCPKYQHKV